MAARELEETVYGEIPGHIDTFSTAIKESSEAFINICDYSTN